MKKNILTIIILCLFAQVNAQMLKGTVTEYGDDGTRKPVVGASIQWLGTNVGANSDGNGNFEIAKNGKTDKLVVRYLAYENDTIAVKKD